MRGSLARASRSSGWLGCRGIRCGRASGLLIVHGADHRGDDAMSSATKPSVYLRWDESGPGVEQHISKAYDLFTTRYPTPILPLSLHKFPTFSYLAGRVRCRFFSSLNLSVDSSSQKTSRLGNGERKRWTVTSRVPKSFAHGFSLAEREK